LPVEVIPFGWPVVARQIEVLGGNYELRQRNISENYITDNGNYILDCNFYPIADAPKLEKDLKMIPGVVEVGLFIQMAHTLIVGNDDRTCTVKEHK
jgi:ribose 5-phosphate isomerase A